LITDKKLAAGIGPELIFDKFIWMTSTEAASYLRVSLGQLRNMVYRGQVRSYHLRNRLRFHKSDLDRALKPSNKLEESK
jgi:excisionase family DNA binding protein